MCEIFPFRAQSQQQINNQTQYSDQRAALFQFHCPRRKFCFRCFKVAFLFDLEFPTYTFKANSCILKFTQIFKCCQFSSCDSLIVNRIFLPNHSNFLTGLQRASATIRKLQFEPILAVAVLRQAKFLVIIIIIKKKTLLCRNNLHRQDGSELRVSVQLYFQPSQREREREGDRVHLQAADTES